MLLADENAADRQRVTQYFDREFSLLYADCGRKAIEQIHQSGDHIDIILLDLALRDIGGDTFLEWLQNSQYRDIPVIVVSADATRQVEALERGAQDFLIKPADLPVLRARVRHVLRRAPRGDTPTQNPELQKLPALPEDASSQGGSAMYKLTEKGFETLYFSDGVARLSGHTREEYAHLVADDAAAIICPADRSRILDAVVTSLRHGSPIHETYRIFHKDGSLVWVRLDGVLVGADEGSPLIHAVFQAAPRLAQLYDNLVDENETIIYVSDVSTYELLYINHTGLHALKKEKTAYCGEKCYAFLFGRTTPCPFCKAHQMNTQDYLDRDFVYPPNNRTYSLRGKLIEWNGAPAHVEYVRDVTEARKSEQAHAALTRQLQAIMENVPGGMCVYQVQNGKLHPVVHNQAFFHLFGYSPEHAASVQQKTDFLNVHPEDLPALQQKIQTAVQSNTPIHHTYRCFHDLRKEYIWICLSAVIVPQTDGTKLCYVSYSDVTAERATQDKLLQAQNVLNNLRQQAQDALDNYQLLVNTIPGGIAQYEVRDDKILTRFFSDGMCDLTGYSKEERQMLCDQDIRFLTYPEDLDLLTSALQSAIAHKENLRITYRIRTKSGTPRWVHLNAAYSPGAHGECLYQAVFTDVDKLKNIEQDLQENQLRYEVAIKSSGINIWEYEIQTDTLYVVSNSSRIKQNCYYITNYIQSTLDHDYVRKDSIDRFLSIFERLRQGAKEVTEDIWYKTTDEAGWWCERVTYTTVFDEAGTPVKAFGAGRDVTREKKAEQKFREEMSYRKAIQSDSLSTIIVDLTGNRVLEVNSSFERVQRLQGCTADAYFAQTADSITGKRFSEKYRKLFFTKKLINRFSGGEFAVSIEMTRLFDTKKVYWVNYSAHLLLNPETRHVMAHISCMDITQEKVMQTIMETVSKTDYEAFVVVDGTTDSALDYGTEGGKNLYDEYASFEQQNEAWIHSYVCQEDVSRVVENCKIQHVWDQVKDGSTYKFSFGMCMPDGSVRRKQLQFTAIDTTRKTFLMSRVDVNSIYEEQEAAKAALQQALADANRANHVKTEFLSRMSHDMRTPMNAMLSFSGFGTESTSLEESQKYHQKIQAAGEYLLQLINDTLDLSKLEAGTMVIRPEPYLCTEFLETITNIVQPRAKEKNIALVMDNAASNPAVAMFDKLRLQQIFINLINNAIKFTPSGGHVTFRIRGQLLDDQTLSTVFSVADDGIGMTEAFQRDMLYKPFVQEHRVENAENGTGLGLSIVKQLVTAMNGTIACNSVPGGGTTFTVTLISPAVHADAAPPVALPRRDADLSGRRVLVCEDHPLNREIADKLLSTMGMAAEMAENGQMGLAQFLASPPGYYAAILMDIRMPVLDGLETARAIRSAHHRDAQTIPIVAMTANAFEEDVQKSLAAGMNAHLPKPIDPKSLRRTLGQLITGQRQ